MAKGGGGGCNRFFYFSWEWEEPLFQTKFLAAVSSLGHLSVKKFFSADLPP